MADGNGHAKDWPGAPLFGSVPVIGADPGDPEIIGAWPMMVFRCKCAKDNESALLAGANAAIICGRCKTRYTIARLNYDKGAGQIELAIGRETPDAPRPGGVRL